MSTENKKYETIAEFISDYTDLTKAACVKTVPSTDDDSGNNSISFQEMDSVVIEGQPAEEHIVSVFDVATYILRIKKSCTTMKLHKLLYYCQAWSLVWDEKPLFKQQIEAWANGPVIRELFNFHKGMYIITYMDMTLGDESNLSTNQKSNIDEVLGFYGDKSAQWLIDQTHLEAPWLQARKGLEQTDRGCRVIELDSIHSYYSSLK